MTVEQLITQILRRLNELDPEHPVRWSRDEILVFVNDAIAELNLIAWLVQANSTKTIDSTHNVYDYPTEVLAAFSLRVGTKYLWRTTVSDLDAEARWEDSTETRLEPKQWATLGLDKFVIHPRPLSDLTAYVEALIEHTELEDDDTALPVTSEYEPLIEGYCVERAEFKEGGAELSQAGQQYADFLDGAQELSGRNIVRSYPRFTAEETPDSLRSTMEAQ